MEISKQLIKAAQDLKKEVDAMTFSSPVEYVYNPLNYAWESHSLYLKRYGNNKKRVLLLGMNPGPWGMAQTGVPFGEIDAVRDWLNIETPVKKPAVQHPKRPVTGFDCKRSEVSGRRLWGLFEKRFRRPETFFQDHFVANFCPLVFMELTGKNRTPDKIVKSEREPLIDVCDRHLLRVIDILEPEYAVGVGAFALNCIRRVVKTSSIKTGVILHPSPASPAANRDWAGTATQQFIDLGIWK
jgi:single-strand selective monofunctional uracil DNA glycosylase